MVRDADAIFVFDDGAPPGRPTYPAARDKTHPIGWLRPMGRSRSAILSAAWRRISAHLRRHPSAPTRRS
jgi:hypothetical protein